MKALAWYTVLFNLAIIIMVLLAAAGTIDAPPFTWLESIVWVVLEIPVVIFGINVARKPK